MNILCFRGKKIFVETAKYATSKEVIKFWDLIKDRLFHPSSIKASINTLDKQKASGGKICIWSPDFPIDTCYKSRKGFIGGNSNPIIFKI